MAGTAADAASAEALGGDEASLGLFDYKQMGAALAQLILLQARTPYSLFACLLGPALT